MNHQSVKRRDWQFLSAMRSLQSRKPSEVTPMEFARMTETEQDDWRRRYADEMRAKQRRPFDPDIQRDHEWEKLKGANGWNGETDRDGM